MSQKESRLPREERRALTRRLLRRAWRYRGVIVLALVTMVLAGLTDTTPILLARVFVDHVLVGGVDPESPHLVDRAVAGLVETVGPPGTDARLVVAAMVAVVMMVVALLAGAATYANEFIAKYLASLVVKDLRVDLLSRVVRLPFAYFTRRKIGDLISRFSNDTQTTYQTINIFVSEVLLQPFVLIFAAIFAVSLNWQLAVVALVFFPAVIYPVLKLGQRVHKRSRRTLVSLGETMEAVNQVLSGLRVVKAFRMEDTEVRHYERVNQDWLRRQVSLVKAKALGRSVMDVVYGGVLAVVLMGGSYLVVKGHWGLTAGDFVAFLVALGSVYRPVKRLSVAYNNWQASIAAAGRVFEVMDTPLEPTDPPGALEAGPIREGVVFQDVEFAYDQADSLPGGGVLRGLSFNIPAGCMVALVGASGAGKTTVANLLLRFYEPSGGTILVDGVPLNRISRTSLLSQIALVSQQPFLFNTTVWENIAYGRPGAGRSEIEEAARAACIHDDILRLPHGYETVVGDRGASLSGGQLQRITIARAILRNASLLLLDEATSSLDAHSERAVQQALDNLLEGRTAIVIAHRLSTIAGADRILVMQEGRIIEEGTHQELMDRQGAYHHLYRVQAVGAG